MLPLLRIDFEEVVLLYETRFRSFARTFTGSRGLHDRLKTHASWQGEALSGKRVLVWTEQGKGDSIMMMRYLPMLKERGAETVTAFCEPPLRRLIGAMRGVDRVVCDATSALETTFDLHCPMM